MGKFHQIQRRIKNEQTISCNQPQTGKVELLTKLNPEERLTSTNGLEKLITRELENNPEMPDEEFDKFSLLEERIKFLADSKMSLPTVVNESNAWPSLDYITTALRSFYNSENKLSDRNLSVDPNWVKSVCAKLGIEVTGSLSKLAGLIKNGMEKNPNAWLPPCRLISDKPGNAPNQATRPPTASAAAIRTL